MTIIKRDIPNDHKAIIKISIIHIGVVISPDRFIAANKAANPTTM